MVNLDLKRAKDLLNSAEKLFEGGDLAGSGGLAYQAFESAVIAVTKFKGEKDYPDHIKRRKKAEKLLKTSEETAKKLWTVRNVDFYGNEKTGEEARELEKDEIETSLTEVRKVIKKIEQELFETDKKTENKRANQGRGKNKNSKES